MPASLIDDKVWFDSNRKLQEICNQVGTSQAEGGKLLLLSHFRSSLSKLEHLLRERGIAYQVFSSFDSNSLCSITSRIVFVGHAGGFQAPNALPRPTPNSAALTIVIAEHHPRQSKDQAVIDAAAKLACDSEVCFHISLDDPLLRHFNGDSIQRLFKQMGISDAECISHPLVTSAIRRAQQQIERLVPKDLKAESIEDWFKYNLPDKI